MYRCQDSVNHETRTHAQTKTTSQKTTTIIKPAKNQELQAPGKTPMLIP
jgi:hypothetical protein